MNTLHFLRPDYMLALAAGTPGGGSIALGVGSSASQSEARLGRGEQTHRPLLAAFQQVAGSAQGSALAHQRRPPSWLPLLARSWKTHH
jgi:hypothetical protein